MPKELTQTYTEFEKLISESLKISENKVPKN